MIKNILSLRSFLYVPCDKPRMLEKSLELDCDCIIYDLEDAVAIGNKDLARTNLLSMKDALSRSVKPILVRVNSADSPFLFEDLEAAVDVSVLGVILPKADAGAVRSVESFFSRIVSDNREMWIIPLIETARSLETISEVLDASERTAAAQFGAEDYTDDLGIPRTDGGEEIDYARHRFVLACRARGKGAIDTPFTDFRNKEALVRDTDRAVKMGMTGKTCIHPDQLSVVNKAFMPTNEDIQEAKKILKAWNSRDDKNSGTAVHDGKMIDRPIVRRAERVMEIVTMDNSDCVAEEQCD